ncbi:hypothetical protein FOA52_005560 [Chlamydomonas sp. UWO 241]|nr:hypothetical protein FOA52_005560 [Chlamydomonas sp. UWO 241]
MQSSVLTRGGNASTTVVPRRSAKSFRCSASRPQRTPEPEPSSGELPTYLRNSLHLSARERVLSLLSQGHDNYNQGELGPAVQELIVSCPVPRNELAAQSFVLGQGTWEVFWAPHLATMSKALGTRFTPIQYKLSGRHLSSHVQYSSPIFGTGWLSASGTMSAVAGGGSGTAGEGGDSVRLAFDAFWVDREGALRLELPAGDSGASTMDGVIGSLGRAAFFPQFAVFPVLYLDPEICVFKFPALESMIAVRKVPAPGLLTA